MGLGQFFGKHWIHVESKEYGIWDSTEYAEEAFNEMLARAPEHARFMPDKARSGARDLVCIMQTRLCQLTLRTCVVWQSSRENGVKLEVFRDHGFGNVSGEWTGFDVDVGETFPVPANYFRISIDMTVHRK